MNKEYIDELLERGYNLNKVGYFRKHILTLYECGIDAMWIRDLNKIQLYYHPIPTRLYMEPWDFSATNAVAEIVKYNMAACLSD